MKNHTEIIGGLIEDSIAYLWVERRSRAETLGSLQAPNSESESNNKWPVANSHPGHKRSTRPTTGLFCEIDLA